MKKELLSPAGNIECAYAAINNGADAVYLSGKNFGARSFADNFSNEEISEIISYAHLVNVKIYVTINTLISDDNFSEALEFAQFLHEENVDAVIVQDLGFVCVLHKILPNLEIHASTQMHNIDKYSFGFLEKIGVKRVVIAREVSVDEINKIDTNLEIEAFIHGSLCISYSGECLFSSMAMNRSGNLGSCSQLCRMPYTLEVNGSKCEKSGAYLLSPKDLATFNNFDLIMNSNITSLKIEGRMKSKEYVGLVTKIYRKLIDAYYDHETVNIEKEVNELKYLFNRGFTEGHILNDNNLMNIKRGNHAGVYIGKVIDVNDKYITIKLEENLKIKDGIKFDASDKGLTVYNLYKGGNQISSAKKGEVVSIPNNIKLEDCENVLKTYDDELNEKLSVSTLKKIKIKVRIKALLNEELFISFCDGVNEVNVTKSVVQKSENKEVTEDDIVNKISKLGTSVYEIDDLLVEKSDNIFIRLSEINEARRELVISLNEKRLKRTLEFKKLEYKEDFLYQKTSNSLAVYVKNKRQLEIVKQYPVDKIYTDNIILMDENSDLDIYFEVYLNDFDIPYKNVVVNSTSDIEKFKGKNLVLNYTLNTYNSYSLNLLKSFGLPTYSVELKLEDYKKMNKKIINVGELLIYGKPRVMMMNHCVLFNERKCDTCNFNGKSKVLKDAFNRDYLLTCKNKINYIYNHKPLLKIRDLSEYKNLGINHFRIDFLDESDYEIRKILNEYFGV